MKVKLLCSRAGVGFSQDLGEEIDIGDDEGLRLIAAGQAELAGSQVETAASKTNAEKATKKWIPSFFQK